MTAAPAMADLLSASPHLATQSEGPGPGSVATSASAADSDGTGGSAATGPAAGCIGTGGTGTGSTSGQGGPSSFNDALDAAATQQSSAPGDDRDSSPATTTPDAADAQ